MLSNVFICTLIMWALTAIVVTPLADRWAANALAGNNELRLAANAEPISDDIKEKIERLRNSKFIQADILVMGITGLIAGLAGFPLIGFAWKAKAWPGLLTLIGSSFFGYHISGGSIK